jgi:hypothetical protein
MNLKYMLCYGVDLSSAFMRIKDHVGLKSPLKSKVFNIKLCTQVRSRVINKNRKHATERKG